MNGNYENHTSSINNLSHGSELLANLELSPYNYQYNYKYGKLPTVNLNSKLFKPTNSHHRYQIPFTETVLKIRYLYSTFLDVTCMSA
jgi:hypothetical protein